VTPVEAPGTAVATRVPVVAVAGRPNVGKSSLVNRVVGRRAAVVERQPGVTRDRKVLDAEWAGVPFKIVDTGGWLPGGDTLEAKVSAQAARAVAAADLVLFVVDVTVGATEEDVAAVRALRRSGRPLLLVANKVDDVSREAGAWELLSLGAGDPWAVSALHGRGTGDLLDEVVRMLGRAGATVGSGRPEDAPEPEAEGHGSGDSPGAGADGGIEAGVAIVGRPNVGKSTLFNRLIGEERSIVHDLPGTTRDAIDTVITTDEGPLRFVDTAGMRRPSRTDKGVESYATLRALEALDRADVALLVIDATVGATHQDQRLAERIGAAGCAAVVVLNKWDLVATGDREEVLAGVADRLGFLGTAPVLRVSASSGRGVHKILPALHAAVEAYHQRVPTGALNRAMREIQAAHPAPGARVRYAVQGAVDPPTFTLFATGRLPQTYLRYIERGLREHFELGPVPVKLRVRVGGR
jgi:GTP-binding protein